jgi:hypothetical protein
MTSLPAWAAEAIDLFASAVAAKLQTPASEYTGASPPQDVSKRSFVKRCPSIAEARREGRLWRCPVAAWHASFVQPGADDDAYAQAVRKAGAR